MWAPHGLVSGTDLGKSYGCAMAAETREEDALAKAGMNQPGSIACKHCCEVSVSAGSQPDWLPLPGVC